MLLLHAGAALALLLSLSLSTGMGFLMLVADVSALLAWFLFVPCDLYALLLLGVYGLGL